MIYLLIAVLFGFQLLLTWQIYKLVFLQIEIIKQTNAISPKLDLVKETNDKILTHIADLNDLCYEISMQEVANSHNQPSAVRIIW